MIEDCLSKVDMKEIMSTVTDSFFYGKIGYLITNKEINEIKVHITKNGVYLNIKKNVVYGKLVSLIIDIYDTRRRHTEKDTLHLAVKENEDLKSIIDRIIDIFRGINTRVRKEILFNRGIFYLSRIYDFTNQKRAVKSRDIKENISFSISTDGLFQLYRGKKVIFRCYKWDKLGRGCRETLFNILLIEFEILYHENKFHPNERIIDVVNLTGQHSRLITEGYYDLF